MSVPNGKWSLESLHQYDGHKWNKTESKVEADLVLFLQEDNLHITRGSTLVEQLCLSSDRKSTKVVFHESTLGFVITRPQGIAKFNVKFSPRCLNIDACLKHIGYYMRVQMANQGGIPQGDTSMNTVVETMLQKGPLTYLKGNTNMVPQNYPVEQIVQLCLLDKELPHFVAEVDTILQQYKKK
ncbi:hypothetical protein WDU94_013557 [Cyamophila willieti]